MADKQHSQASNQTVTQTAKAAAAARKQARLSQALKANMARRKGQARARASEGENLGSAQGANNNSGAAQDAAYEED
tara:strand:- start:568 stop:798 length:231 start_codon:yes stop_codon:yes gene_type:complete